ncbi:MAG: hypothetical protein CMF60_06850 [Magnetococcales bacterium]|nr:hypothetical protein [Magnetococcales bacterium]|tara:strand:- start:8283 stop:8888 length:606 start_codon:yes stop_codon:yes gene_type:complete
MWIAIMTLVILIVVIAAFFYFCKNHTAYLVQTIQKAIVGDERIFQGTINGCVRDHQVKQMRSANDVQLQMKLAVELFNGTRLPLGPHGQVVGVIDGSRFVLETPNGKRKIICDHCTEHLVGLYCSDRNLGKHEQGVETVNGLSARDYVSITLACNKAFNSTVLGMRSTERCLHISRDFVEHTGVLPDCGCKVSKSCRSLNG